jgi:DNA processing protein
MGHGFQEPDQQAPMPSTPADNLDAEADRIRAQIEEMLGVTPVEIDELIRQSGASTGAVLMIVLELELAGRCRRYPGNRVGWADVPVLT